MSVRSKLQKANNQRQLSDGAFLFIFGTATAIVLITAEIVLILKGGVMALYHKVRSFV